MDLARLKEILDWMERSKVAELELADGDFQVHLKRAMAPGVAAAAVPAAPAAASPSKGHDIVAASFGIIHLSPAPSAPPFVTLGQSVSAGQSLCTIEAMKVFSPIEANRSGKLVAILVEDGAEVEAGQSLFRIE